MLIWVVLGACVAQVAGTEYTVALDAAAVGRQFQGIGAISGGGATSKLLFNYEKKYLSQILDYLFLPGFGASLQIIKVEIGGGADSTEGTEACHWPNEWEEPNYHRGYEWQMLLEAKKRNPSIKTAALSWTWPGFLGGKLLTSPYHNNVLTAQYTVSWLEGARRHHGVTIDYIGIWNERPYDNDYIVTLRGALDAAGFAGTQIVAPDGINWKVAEEVLANQTVADAVDAIGVHYPGTFSTADAVQTGKSLWASEDYSTFQDNVGNGCWARILNNNFVNGQMTATIAWNLITSYYDDLPYPRCSLTTANQPWSGHYEVNNNIWIAAHTTQFTQPGWHYLSIGAGSGNLTSGGSYVTLVDNPDTPDKFAIVIQTMTYNHSICIRPTIPFFDVHHQNATFVLSGQNIPSSLFARYTKIGFNGQDSKVFDLLDPVNIGPDRSFTLELGQDEIWTLTNVGPGNKGEHSYIPPGQEFPATYEDRFQDQPEFAEPFNFGPQVGSFEILAHNNERFVRQNVLTSPVKWCNQAITRPISVGGRYNASHQLVQMDIRFPAVNATSGIFIANWLRGGFGCYILKASGLIFEVTSDSKFKIAGNYALTDVIASGDLPEEIALERWYQLDLRTKPFNSTHSEVVASFAKQQVYYGFLETKLGFVGYGTATYGLGDFANFYIESLE
jgi:galactosylceramidase